MAVFFSLSLPYALFAAGGKQKQSVSKELQEKYNALETPGIIMLPANGTSAVPAATLARVEKELLKQLVNDGKVKPVRMQDWLSASYKNKANNPFAIMNAIKEEQYALPVKYIGVPTVFRSGMQYYLVLYVYLLETYYPLIIFRRWTSFYTLGDMIASCVEEMNTRISQPVSGSARKRVVVDDFKVEFYKLVEHSSGELDFISMPFLEKDEMTLREGDDYFSRTMGYILSTTNLFQTIQVGDFREYSNANVGTGSTLVDYRIQGRVQLSDYECVLYVEVIDIRTRSSVVSLRYLLPSYSYDAVWNAYRKISVQIISKLFERGVYGVVPALSAQGYSFFANNMLVGWDALDDYVLEKGLHVISTGTAYSAKDSVGGVRAYHILLDDQVSIFYDKKGKRIWNLLKK
jgi:hypothetical protein